MATIQTYDVTSNSFTGAANREDLLDIITIISPIDTPLFTMLRKTKVNNTLTEWMTDLLDGASSNAEIEGSSAVFQGIQLRQRLSNYTQVSREAYDISDTQRAVNPAGIRDELRYQMSKALKQWKRDVEHDIVNGATASGQTAVARSARGIYEFLAGFSSVTADVSNAATNSANQVQEDDLNGRLQAVWVVGGMCDYVLCTPRTKRAISSDFAGSANTRRNAPVTDNAVTNVVDWYYSDFGNVKILPHRWFSSANPNSANLQRVTFLLQSDKWVLGFLRPPRNVPLAKIGSSERAMVEGEWTLVCLHPSANSFVSGHHSGVYASNFPTN